MAEWRELKMIVFEGFSRDFTARGKGKLQGKSNN